MPEQLKQRKQVAKKSGRVLPNERKHGKAGIRKKKKENDLDPSWADVGLVVSARYGSEQMQ